jgi:hypothetical protein
VSSVSPSAPPLRATSRVRLSKARKLLRRQGVAVTYATLRRFAIAELGVGGTATTIPVADRGPGEEVQLDTGWMTHLAPDATRQISDLTRTASPSSGRSGAALR